MTELVILLNHMNRVMLLSPHASLARPLEPVVRPLGSDARVRMLGLEVSPVRFG